MENLGRRGFLGALAAGIFAPAIIKTPGLLMPIKPSLVPAKDVLIWSDTGVYPLTLRADGAVTFTIHGKNQYGHDVTEKIGMNSGGAVIGTRIPMQKIISVQCHSYFYDSNPRVTVTTGEHPIIMHVHPSGPESYLDVKNNPWGPAYIQAHKDGPTMIVGIDPDPHTRPYA